MESSAPEPADVLNGWKEIASHLGRSARSVQRWERDLGLPIHRIPTPDGGSIVYALKSEVVAWRARLEEHASTRAANEWLVPEEPGHVEAPVVTAPADAAPDQGTRGSVHRWLNAPVPAWAALGMASVAVAAVVTGGSIYPATGVPSSWEFEGRELRAYTDGGREIWHHSFDRPVSRPATMRGPGAYADVNEDGRTDLLVPARFAAPRESPAESDAVVAFSHDGSTIWSLQPTLRFTTGSETFEGPWHVYDIATGATAKGPRTWIAYSHHTWWPAFVMEVAPNGEQHLAYVQPGRIYSLTYWQSPGGTRLVAGGTLNEESRASVAVVDVNRGPARWRSAIGPALECPTCPAADPEAMLLLPTSDVTRGLFRPYGWVMRSRLLDSGLELTINDGFGWGTHATLSEGLQITGLARSDQYWHMHQDLERQGRIPHTADECPDHAQPLDVRRWTPATGWSTEPVRLRRPAVGQAPVG